VLCIEDDEDRNHHGFLEEINVLAQANVEGKHKKYS
jgi:hypothetical protein